MQRTRRPGAVLLLLLCGLLAVLAPGCSGGNEAPRDSTEAPGTAAPPTRGPTSGSGPSAPGPAGTATNPSTTGGPAAGPRIAILQIVSQPALDAVVQGFEEGLAEAGYRDGETAAIEVLSAGGDEATAKRLAGELARDSPDLILAVAEAAAQAAASATKDTPVLFSAVTDPVAAGLVTDPDRPAGNVTGVSDALPVRAHLDLLRTLLPQAERVGLIYNPADSESWALVQEERLAAAALGLRTVEVTVRDTAEVLGAAESLAGRVDALSVLSDSTVLAALESVVKVSNEKRVPLFAGDAASVQRGALAAWTFDYCEHGRQAAGMAVRLLRGAQPAQLPVEHADRLSLALNRQAAAALGIAVPADLLEEAGVVY